MIRSNYIVHDVETGGTNKRKNPITQYACIVLDFKTLKEIDRFETYIRPYNNLVIEKEALEHTMVSMADIRRGITVENFVEVLFEFYKMHQAKGKFKDANRLVPVGHNIVFDNGFLSVACELCGKDYYEYIHENFIDTMPLAKMTWGLEGNEKIRLSDCVERANLRITDAHGAMNDVEANADLFRWFIKKLRSKKGAAETAEQEMRARGREFFEFKCGAK